MTCLPPCILALLLPLPRTQNPLPCGRGLILLGSPSFQAVFPTPFPRGVWRNQPERVSWLSAIADHSCGAAPDSTAALRKSSNSALPASPLSPPIRGSGTQAGTYSVVSVSIRYFDFVGSDGFHITSWTVGTT